MDSVRYTIIEHDDKVDSFVNHIANCSKTSSLPVESAFNNPNIDWIIIGSQEGSEKKHIVSGLSTIKDGLVHRSGSKKLAKTDNKIINRSASPILDKLNDLMSNLWSSMGIDFTNL